MSIKQIVTDVDKLAMVSLPVDDHREALTIIDDIMHTAHDCSQKPLGCLGLACNQIGILKRIIVVDIAGEFVPMINPVIDYIHTAAGKMNGKESCLSRPKITVKIKRYKKITVSYTDISGARITTKFSKMTARVIQHEINHLDGKYI